MDAIENQNLKNELNVEISKLYIEREIFFFFFLNYCASISRDFFFLNKSNLLVPFLSQIFTR